jgi:cytoskeletal protein CcmA (bactofilin family)
MLPFCVTTISSSIVIVGEVISTEDLTLQGRVNGWVLVRNAAFTIGGQAQLSADVRATRVFVHGRLTGAIVASERIELAPGASVEGSLNDNQVVLTDGSHFNGSIDMGQRTIAARLAQFKASQRAPG